MYPKIIGIDDVREQVVERLDYNQLIPLHQRHRLNQQHTRLKYSGTLAFVQKAKLPASIRAHESLMKRFFQDVHRDDLVVAVRKDEVITVLDQLSPAAPVPISIDDKMAFLDLLSDAFSDGLLAFEKKFSVGMGKKHSDRIKKYINSILGRYPWMKQKELHLIIFELLTNIQSANIRHIADKISRGEKVPGYFHLNLIFNDRYIIVNIYEYGEHFDYNEYCEQHKLYTDDIEPLDYDLFSEHTMKLVLRENDKIDHIATPHHGRGLRFIEKFTDNLFYMVPVFHEVMRNGIKEKEYAYKMIFARIDRD